MMLKDERIRSFFILDNEVVDDERLTHKEMAVYIMLCRHVNKETGACFPSLSTIGKKVGMSKNTVIKSLNILIEMGYVTKEKRASKEQGNMSNCYCINDVHQLNRGVQEMNGACSGDERRLVHEVSTNNTNINNTKLTRYILSETEEETPSEKAIVQQQEEKEACECIFQHWNEKEIIEHRVLTQKTVSKIKARLNTFGVEELQQAIDHYHTVLTRPEYFWEYRWSLQEFLRSDENVEKFLNTAYLKGLRKKEFQHQVDLPTARTSGFSPAKGIVESQVDVDDIYATLGDGV
ncbi:TPA: helix-turn-helix domain-containing protein [Bacillus cereus]|nr:helix-turn-helix domain-containing protein [Bacillus cereus]HDR8459434.1 helix-turn-helix domain-containing protein [Bacillus cereus]